MWDIDENRIWEREEKKRYELDQNDHWQRLADKKMETIKKGD